MTATPRRGSSSSRSRNGEVRYGLTTWSERRAEPSTSRTRSADGESIGILRFSRGGAARLLAELEQMVRTDTAVDDWYLRAVERIALSGYEVGTVEVNGLRWAEIDFPHDLEWVRGNLGDLVL